MQKNKEIAGRDGPLAPAARRAARLLLKKNDADADADAEKRDASVSDDVSASREGEKEKEDVSREDREVFGSAADAILAAADAAAEAARRADEKDRAAERRGSGAAAPPPRADQSELEGPALAARGKALEAVAATAAKDSTVSRLVRVRSRQAKEEVAELTPTALVAASFQGAAEVRLPLVFRLSSFSRVFFFIFREEGALLHSAARPFRAESVFSRSQKDVRAAALVAQFIAPSRNAGRVMESGSPPASPKTPDEMRRRAVFGYFFGSKAFLSTFFSSRALALARKRNSRPAGTDAHSTQTRSDDDRTSSTSPRRSAR